MNILIFGKNGQLGRAFQEYFQNSYFGKCNNIFIVGRNECDFRDVKRIVNLLNTLKPQLLINAAAYNAVDSAEAESDLAFAINANAPEVMAQYAAQFGATLLHFSSDYVFDGSKQDPYIETDSVNPLSVYGKSKEAGELAIHNVFSNSPSGQYAILRTSWLYGNGSNFIRTILRLAEEQSALRVIRDQCGVPTSAAWLAEVACNLVLNNEMPRHFTSGIYHAVPRGDTNRYSLACLVIQSALDSGREFQISPAAITPVLASDYPVRARRPMNSRLSTKKLQLELKRLGLVSRLPHWDTPWNEQVITYVNQLTKN